MEYFRASCEKKEQHTGGRKEKADLDLSINASIIWTRTMWRPAVVMVKKWLGGKKHYYHMVYSGS